MASSNLYKQENQSVLIDVDGVVIAPMGELIINAPSGFDEVRISLPRGEKSHGFNYEFSDAETPFGFDKVKFAQDDIYSPYSLIKAIYEFSGVDAAIMFEFRARKSSDVPFESQYLGDLDFEEVEILDLKINVTSRRKNLDDLFRTRQKTKVSFGATESIDGEAITGLVADDVFLHSKVIKSNFVSGDDLVGIPAVTTNISSNADWKSNIDFGVVLVNGIETYNKGTLFFIDETLSPLEPMFTLKSGGKFLINSIGTAIYLATASGAGTIDIGLYYRIGLDGNENIIGSPLNLSFTGGTSGQDLFINETDVIIDIPVLDFKNEVVDLYLYWKVEMDTTTGSGTFRDGDFGINVSDIDITFDSVNNNSSTKAYKPFEATNHILEVINNRTDMIISSFITDEANDIYQTNGYSIRGFEDRLPETSFDDQFYKWLQPMFGLGYAVVYDVDKFKVLIERYSHFYQDVEIDYFDTINDGSWSITADKSVIFNEFEVGYSKFPSSTDENTQNTIDEFNTIHNDLSPIKTVEKKATYKSEAIGSGYLLENSRREQFKEVPSDTVTNDDAMFLAKTVNNDLYTIEGDFALGINSVETDNVENTVKLLGTYFDIRVGDVINLNRVSGASPIEGNYTVSAVTLIGNNTLLTCASVTATGTSTDEYEITLPENRLRAERNENVDVLNNVISPETSYNVGLNPKNMLINQSPLFNSGFHPKPDTAEIKTQTVALNGEMESQFAIGEGGYVLDPARQLIKQNQNLTLLQTNQNIKLFTGRLIKFTTTINYDRVLLIRDACLNVSTNGDNYGYVRVKDPFGVDYKGFIMNMEYNPLSEEVDFELREKF